MIKRLSKMIILAVIIGMTSAGCSTTSSQPEANTKPQKLNQANDDNIIDMLQARIKHVGQMVELKTELKEAKNQLQKSSADVDKLTALQKKSESMIKSLTADLEASKKETLRLKEELSRREKYDQKIETIESLLQKLMNAEEEASKRLLEESQLSQTDDIIILAG